MRRIVFQSIFIILFTLTFNFAQSHIESKTNELLNKVEITESELKPLAYMDLLSYMVKTAPDKSIPIALKAIEETNESNNPEYSAYLLLYLGIAYAKIHIQDTSKLYLEEALTIMEEVKDSAGLCKSHISLGYINIVTGNLTEAIQHFITAEEISNAIDEIDSYIDALNYLGIINYILDNLESAVENSERALQLSKEHEYLPGEALAYEHLAIINIKKGNFNIALEYNSKSFAIREQLDDLTSISELYDNYSIIYNRMSDYNKAIEYTKKSLELRRRYGDLNGMGSTYMNLGNIHISLNEYDKALEYLLIAYNIKKESRDLRAFTAILRNLAQIYESKNDFRNAFLHLSEFRVYYDSLFNENTRRLVSRTEAKHELKNKENQITALQERSNFQEQIQQFLIIILVLGLFLTVAVVVAYIINRKANKKLNLVNEELSAQKNELAKLNKELVILNNDREKFFSIIAHDLRSPFFPLLTYSELLSDNGEKLNDHDVKKYSHNINQSAKKVFSLLENLLQWIGLNSGKIKFSPEVINLSELIVRMTELYSENASEKNIDLIYNKNSHVNVYADPEMAAIILRNLISNAMKFTKSDGKIIIDTKDLNDFIEVSVRDTGTGMDDKTHSTLFTTATVSVDGTNDERGSGLGLMLCKEMVTRNGGKISVESEPGVGTTFRFTLPKVKSQVLQ